METEKPRVFHHCELVLIYVVVGAQVSVICMTDCLPLNGKQVKESTCKYF